MIDTLNIGTSSSANSQNLAFLVGILAIAFTLIILLIIRISKKKKKNRKLRNSATTSEPDYSQFDSSHRVRRESKTETVTPPMKPRNDTVEHVPTKPTSPKENINSTIPSIVNNTFANRRAESPSKVAAPSKALKVKVNPKTIFVKAEEEIRNSIKFIGYEPNDDFLQREPFNYPYVIMPRPRSVIKFPRKNKSGNKGYTEDFFSKFITQYFKTYFKIYNDRVLIISNKQNPYEPDIALIDEKDGLNLFVDIEIDEPYDGISREPMHFVGYDKERNKFFKYRGWLTIRFAEEQVWKQPESCCKFLFLVFNSINDKILIPNELEVIDSIDFIPQWTMEQAKKWSDIKYREDYLGIKNFDVQNIHKELEAISKSSLEDKIESQVIEVEVKYTSSLKEAIVKQAINTGKYISCKIASDRSYTILRPESFDGRTLKGYCYVENQNRQIGVNNIADLIIRDQPFLVRLNGEIGVAEIKRVVNDAIQNNKLIRMKYTRSTWTEQIVNEETGEIILNVTEAEESLRTISDVNYAINALDEEHFNRYNLNKDDYITAFCHKRHQQRTFKFQRINELEILNV
jgi:hypothetical protein